MKTLQDIIGCYEGQFEQDDDRQQSLNDCLQILTTRIYSEDDPDNVEYSAGLLLAMASLASIFNFNEANIVIEVEKTRIDGSPNYYTGELLIGVGKIMKDGKWAIDPNADREKVLDVLAMMYENILYEAGGMETAIKILVKILEEDN